MNHPPAPDYDELDRLLHEAGLEISAAEAHGRVAGFVCATGGRGASGAVLLFRDEAGGTNSQLEQGIVRLARACHEQLDGQEFGFEPLLPDDEVSAAALGDWCRGFLDGLISGGLRNIRGLPGDVGEFVKDLVLLGEAEPDPDVSDEDEDEARALAELIEYLRAGAQLVYDEHRQAPDN